MATVRVRRVRAERGDLGSGITWTGIGGVLERRNFVHGLIGHKHDAEVGAHRERAGKHAENKVGSGGGGHVVVDGIEPQQEVAHAAAREIGLVAIGAESLDDAEGSFELARKCGHVQGSRRRARFRNGCPRPAAALPDELATEFPSGIELCLL